MKIVSTSSASHEQRLSEQLVRSGLIHILVPFFSLFEIPLLREIMLWRFLLALMDGVERKPITTHGRIMVTVMRFACRYRASHRYILFISRIDPQTTDQYPHLSVVIFRRGHPNRDASSSDP